MAEMLIFMNDQTNADGIELTAKLPQRGDVVVVRPDGWPWGDMERNSPLFALVIVPDAVPADLATFLSPEVPLAPLGDNETWASTTNTLQYRGFRVDVDAYTGGVLRAGEDATVPLAEINALKVQKPPIPDPKVIGDTGQVIG